MRFHGSHGVCRLSAGCLKAVSRLLLRVACGLLCGAPAEFDGSSGVFLAAEKQVIIASVSCILLRAFTDLCIVWFLISVVLILLPCLFFLQVVCDSGLLEKSKTGKRQKSGLEGGLEYVLVNFCRPAAGLITSLLASRKEGFPVDQASTDSERAACSRLRLPLLLTRQIRTTGK